MSSRWWRYYTQGPMAGALRGDGRRRDGPYDTTTRALRVETGYVSKVSYRGPNWRPVSEDEARAIVAMYFAEVAMED